MSKAKDRARAKSGIIFRDGNYVNKEEWYAAHPTSEMLVEQQAQVDVAVAQEMARFDPDPEPFIPDPYYCRKCDRAHRPNTKIYQAHLDYILINGIPEDGSDPTH